ncbi:MAG TPA: hypothetical protein VK988_04480 [Acidimicrobiales bacterium]|nr:hypothetical protein [Acidimicrobiales bacterium]
MDRPHVPGRAAQLRRSVAMLHPGDPAGLDRETALAVLAELERLERSERHLLRLQEQLHAIVDEFDQSLR